jgi:hypothetical protein
VSRLGTRLSLTEANEILSRIKARGNLSLTKARRSLPLGQRSLGSRDNVVLNSLAHLCGFIREPQMQIHLAKCLGPNLPKLLSLNPPANLLSLKPPGIKSHVPGKRKDPPLGESHLDPASKKSKVDLERYFNSLIKDEEALPRLEDATVTEEPSSLSAGICEHHAENPPVGEFGVGPSKGSSDTRENSPEQLRDFRLVGKGLPTQSLEGGFLENLFNVLSGAILRKFMTDSVG